MLIYTQALGNELCAPKRQSWIQLALDYVEGIILIFSYKVTQYSAKMYGHHMQ